MGRVGVDLYPNELRTPLREVRTFTRYVGGFAGNVATGLARLGVGTAIVSRVGDEGHGEFVRDFLEREGVDTRFLAVDPYWQTPPTFCEVWPPDDFPLTFYRKPTGARLAALARRLRPGRGRRRAAAVRDRDRARAVAVARDHARRARGAPRHDDLRPRLAAEPLVRADRVPGARAPRGRVGGHRRRQRGGARRGGADERPERLVLKRGGKGATVFDGGDETEVPVHPVEVVNGLGAGDAFAAALGHALLRGMSLVDGVRRGSVAGALVAAQLACSRRCRRSTSSRRRCEAAPTRRRVVDDHAGRRGVALPDVRRRARRDCRTRDG